MPKYHYLNEKIITENKANISMNDIGVLRGYGVFDFLRTYNGKPFLLKEHYERFKQSSKTLGLSAPVGEKKLESIIKTLIKKNKMKEANIRIVLTGGKTEDGMSITSPTFFILMEKEHTLPKNIYSLGAKLITYEHMRGLPGAKTLDYKIAVSLQKLRKEKNAIEILYKYNGNILEAATSNFFIFRNDALITPKDNILIGTTRNFVLKLAKKAGFKTKERNIPIKELKNATESFITATSKEIVPIVKIDNARIGDGKAGKNTKILMALFKEQTENF